MKRSVIKLLKYPHLLEEPSTEHKLKYDEFVRNSYEEQKILLREERKKQIELYVDKIVKAKGGEKSREDVIKEELDKLPELEFDNIINPVFTEHPEFLKGKYSAGLENSLG